MVASAAQRLVLAVWRTENQLRQRTKVNVETTHKKKAKAKSAAHIVGQDYMTKEAT